MIKGSFLINEGYENNFRIKDASGQYIRLSNKKKLIDTSFSSGTLILGHSNRVASTPIKKQIKKGIAYGLPNLNADKFSFLLKKVFKNYSKFIFCSTGSEANTKAIRIARSISNKEYVVMTSGSWHGSVDQLLFDENLNKSSKKTLSHGLTEDIKKKIIVVPYNNIKETVKIIEKFKSKIALVIMEPIQQALPSIYSESYIKKVHNFCKKKKILICFDEMITGIRVEKFSVQNKLNLNPDISTFGKIIGGGLPIGVIAIKRKIETQLKKNENKVFFGGTFSANSLVSEVGYQTLKYIIKNKKIIFNKLEHLSNYLEKKLNLFFIKENINVKLIRYNSIIRICFSKKNIKNKKEREKIETRLRNKIIKFKKYALKNGIYLSKNGAIFLSTSHSLQSIKYIVKVLEKASKKFFSK